MYTSSMKAQQDIFTGTRTTLTRHDLITYDHLLAEAVSRFLPFKSYSLYFPKGKQPAEAVWDPSDRKLLLPLQLQGRMLGVFVARGISLRGRRGMLPLLPGLAEQALEKLYLYKMSITDPATGLFSRQYLKQAICREVELIRECFRPAGDGCCDINASAVQGGYHACMGVVTFAFDSMKHVIRDYGFIFADDLTVMLADTLVACAPESAFVSRTGDYEFTVFIPGGTVTACRKLAKQAVRELRAVRLVHELTEDKVGVNACAGYAAYPQDFEGYLFEREISEQARLLLRKARIASGIAGEKSVGEALEYVMGYNRILVEGGKVLETMPMSRVMVSLGRSMGAREGGRYSVWSTEYDSRKISVPENGGNGQNGGKAPMYKGEIVLMEIRETQSLAEVMHLGDPTWAIEPGDRITLMPEEKGIAAPSDSEEAHLDPITGLFRHRDFLARFSREREKCDTFAVALLRLTGADRSFGNRASHAEQLIAESAEVCRSILGPDVLGGRYGLNSLVYFHANVTPAQMLELYTTLCGTLDTKLHIESAAGVACHPFLSYRKADSLENCLKALEYAMLCAKPKVGLMDSVALNISADKLFSKGDTFEAIEEYKRALLADDGNTMAWNSLGVCYAGLGRPQDARKQFEEALKRNRKDVMALYNLGNVCHTMGEVKEAREFYRKCLKQNPSHFFALIRLGQLSEGEKKYSIARQYYNKAAKLGENQALVQRHLARLCMRQGRLDEARECLHQALIHNPQDALALQLMAKLYLDGGEDPEIAEVLARQAAALRPDLKSAWLELARAFEVRGKHQDAREALLKAGAL
ncbi:tetratricopeptide repeat protein [Desulfovibrio subterraneus]|uniref:tetratricopeptide repeat-containing diguanylate cyclase n=1 Tax=Desulfovibrio subterraneus TaxID=2718620 RepID=UPI0022B8BE26|nr:tetratricopeptide repeat protein [Desulfovibrio subterraneus]WBF68665.1 tetratricopeptide repeat protein [Desulfovibrio subterraneus]